MQGLFSLMLAVLYKTFVVGKPRKGHSWLQPSLSLSRHVPAWTVQKCWFEVDHASIDRSRVA